MEKTDFFVKNAFARWTGEIWHPIRRSPSQDGKQTALAECARIAQLVEQRIENPRVGGSNPPPGTTYLFEIIG